MWRHHFFRGLSILFSLMLIMSVTNCGDDSTVFAPPAGGDATTTTFPDALAAKTFVFVDTAGDDGVSCQGVSQCAKFLSYGEARELKVMYLEKQDGDLAPAPKLGIPITFSVHDGDATAATLTALSTTTDSTGTATMGIKAADKVGSVTIKAQVSGVTPELALYFKVNVTPKGQMPLTIVLQYQGQRAAETVDVTLFRQNAAGGTPKCADLKPGDLPTADQSKSETKPLPYSVNFPEFLNLQTDTPQYYAIVAVGHKVGGPPLVWACEDGSDPLKETRVAFGHTNSLTMVLEDIPPSLVGRYELENYFDLVSALPEPWQTSVQTVLNFFKSPSGTLLSLVCQIDSSDLSSFCGYLFKDPDNPCVDPPETCLKNPVGVAAFAVLDGVIYDLLENNFGGFGADIFGVGQDVEEMLNNLNIESTMEFYVEPDLEGVIPELTAAGTPGAEEMWHTLNYRWTYGSECSPQDMACGWRSYSMYEIPGLSKDILTGQFSGKFENNMLTVDPHPLRLSYGALLNFIFEQLVLPLISGDDDVNTWEMFLYTLVGGKDCLPGPLNDPTLKTCCEEFAEGSTNATSGTVYTIAKVGCDTLVTEGAKYLRAQLTSLDTQSGENIMIGTPLDDETTVGVDESMPCEVKDSDDDLLIDEIGGVGKPCTWELQLNFTTEADNIDASFYGLREE